MFRGRSSDGINGVCSPYPICRHQGPPGDNEALAREAPATPGQRVCIQSSATEKILNRICISVAVQNILNMASDSFSRIEIANLEGRAQSTRFRQKVLHTLHQALRSAEKTIKDAIYMDTGYSELETTLEYTLAVSELRIHYNSLSLEEDLKSQRATENPSATTSVGIIFIHPSNRNLFYSVISSTAAAIAAGNCVILEVR
jgi:acyl-CoA reductase-like NAD-dependent aldehyde dehydrogenase